MKPELPFTIDATVQPDDIVFAVDRSGRILFWNDLAAQVLGIAAEQALGQELVALLPPFGAKDGPQLERILAGRDFAAGIDCQNSSGQRVALYVFGTAGRDSAGKPAGVVFVCRDVTEFWRAEEAVRESEARYRLLFENTSDAVAIADAEGRVLEVNPACQQLYGYTTDEVRQMNLIDVVAPESRAEAAAAMERLAKGQPVSGRLKMLRKDGRELVVELLAISSVINGQRRIVSITRDITEREQALARVRASESRYRRIFESASDGLFLETLDGRIVDVNENACRMLGYTRAELLALRVEDIVPEETRAWLPGVRNTVLSKGRFQAEVTNIRKDGTPISVELVATIFDAEPGEKLVLTSIRDISERQQAERRLRESEARYRAVFETTGLATIIIEEDTTVSLVNQEFTRLFGYGVDEVTGRSWTEFVHPEDLPRMREYHRLRRIDAAAAPRHYEFRLVDRHGHVRDCLLTIDMIPGTGRSVASIQDITERKRDLRELAESRQRYRELFHNSPIGIYRTTPDGKILMANPRLMEMLGYTSYAEFIARDLEKEGYEPSYPRQRFKEVIERDGEVRGLESIWVCRDGRKIYVRENARVVRDEQGRVRYYEGTVEDITESKLAQQRLAEQEADFRALAENSGDAILIGDFAADSPNLYVNRRAAELFGMTTEELQRKRVSELVTASSLARLDEYTSRRQAGEDAPNRYDIEIRRADGTILPVEVTVGPTHWHGRQALIITLRDTTERVRILRALEQSEARYRALLASIRDGITTADAQGRITAVNDVVVRRSGRPREWWIGRYHADVVLPEYRAVAEQQFAAALRGEPPAPYEISYRAEDGRLVELEMHAAPLRDGERIIGVLGVGRDISERKRIERQLRESEEQFRRLVELLPDGMAVHQDGKVVLANQAAARILGYADPSEAIGRPVMDFVAPASRPLVAARVQQALKTGQAGEPLEENFVRKDGSVVTVEVINAPTVWRGRPAVQVVFRDITARKQAEQQEREQEEAFRQLVELSPEGIVVHQDGRIVLANLAAARLLGYSGPGEMVGQAVVDFIPVEDRPAILARMQRIVTGGKPVEPAVERFLRKDGTSVELAVVPAPFTWRGRPAVQVVFRSAIPSQT